MTTEKRDSYKNGDSAFKIPRMIVFRRVENPEDVMRLEDTAVISFRAM